LGTFALVTNTDQTTHETIFRSTYDGRRIIIRIHVIYIAYNGVCSFSACGVNDRLQTLRNVGRINTRRRCFASFEHATPSNKSPIPIRTKLLIYQMYVRSVITYTGQAWTPLISRFNWKKFESVQNRNLRTILQAPLYVSNTDVHKSTKLPTIQSLIRNDTKILIHKNSASHYTHISEIGRFLLLPSSSRKPVPSFGQRHPNNHNHKFHSLTHLLQFKRASPDIRLVVLSQCNCFASNGGSLLQLLLPSVGWF